MPADNHSVNINTSSISCGVLELSRPEAEPEKVLYALACALYHPSRGSPAAFVVWSDVKDSNGEKLFLYAQELLAKENFMASPWEENPKTGNLIRVFTMAIPHENFRQWYKKQRIKRMSSL